MTKLFAGCLQAAILVAFGLVSCKNTSTRFALLDSTKTNLRFNNYIQETDSVNIIDLSNVYNGGGVGIGDFNNDGLQDIYFTGNLVPNKLFLNQGKLTFKDITSQAKVSGEGKWCRGVSVVDINADGLLDIYVCATINPDSAKRQNILYINNGMDKNGVPSFTDKAAEYGLNDPGYSTMAAFFDFDNDGDLDVYVAANQITDLDNPNVYKKLAQDGSFRSTGKLYKNDWNDSLKHGYFTNYSKQANTGIEGYAHAVVATDINQDGYTDLYITNDYLSNNILYINNGNGTFTDKAKTYFKHTSSNAMGQDVIDINNDGLADVVELDMNPRDNFRKKMFLAPNNYQMYQNTEYYGYQFQYVRNTVQLNQGPRVNEKDSIGDPVFSETSFFCNVAETDWSWTPLVTDFDNDGNRDMIITNGFPKDITDHDFGVFRQKAFSLVTKKELLAEIPAVKIANYAFKNNGDVTFSDVTEEWGINQPTFSNGAAYADLDNDGDLDFVINNINDNASVYQNTTVDNNKETSNYLSINFLGEAQNKNGYGAIATVYYDKNKKQVYENTPYRGYLSSVQAGAHFGMGNITKADSVIIVWPGGKKQVLQNIACNQLIKVNSKDALLTHTYFKDVIAKNTVFTDITSSLGVRYQHHDSDFIDFNIQKLLPHKFTEYGPALAAGDVDNNGLGDIIIGGSKFNHTSLLLQQAGGSFAQKAIGKTGNAKQAEDMGVLLFDADGDADLDLYVAAGSGETERNTIAYRDELYINDGRGGFVTDTAALPVNLTSKSCVRAADFDKDGDLDLFIAGRVDPWNYPKPVSCFLYRNDSKPGKPAFTDITATAAKTLQNIGLTCDAVFTDFDNDGWPDLLLAGEWMPLTFLKNENGVFKNITQSTGIASQTGWWNSIASGDFDNDGDMDYVAGNLGLNSFYKASDAEPAAIYAKDFDNNGSYDAFPATFIAASKDNQQR
ncbi:MAG: hypothetical protein RL172_1677, partial [Bacteroidota bacterium]